MFAPMTGTNKNTLKPDTQHSLNLLSYWSIRKWAKISAQLPAPCWIAACTTWNRQSQRRLAKWTRQAMSSGALDLMPPVQIYPTVADAIADCHTIYATTARPRDLVKPVFKSSTRRKNITETIKSGQKRPFCSAQSVVTHKWRRNRLCP